MDSHGWGQRVTNECIMAPFRWTMNHLSFCFVSGDKILNMSNNACHQLRWLFGHPDKLLWLSKYRNFNWLTNTTWETTVQ